MATNNITGDSLVSRFGNKDAQEKFDNNFDKVFGKKEKKTNGGWTPPPLPLNEYPDNSNDEWDETRIDRIGANGATGDHYETKD